jgi:RimJ/RimL family protein N-acetyltransferase
MDERIVLRDGTRAAIRPFRRIPREAIEQAYSELSPASQYDRFLTGVSHLNDQMLHHLVDEVDGVNHVAILLAVEPDVGPESVIGVARMIRYRHDPASADVAVSVREEWHGRGAANALLRALMRQRPEGVTRIVTTVAADNAASFAMLRHLGALHATPAQGNVVDVVVDLDDDRLDDHSADGGLAVTRGEPGSV